MRLLFHGSAVPGITVLEPRSLLHGTEAVRVTYLTENVPYALFCIWDAARHGGAPAHVTGWSPPGSPGANGVTFYEEQFPDQLRTFYEGVSGFLYCAEDSERLSPVEGRPGMFYSTEPVPVAEVWSVSDVYEALLAQEAAGNFKVLRYTEQSPERQEELVDLIAAAIAHDGFYEHDEVRRRFMQTYFAPAWARANHLRR